MPRRTGKPDAPPTPIGSDTIEPVASAASPSVRKRPVVKAISDAVVSGQPSALVKPAGKVAEKAVRGPKTVSPAAAKAALSSAKPVREKAPKAAASVGRGAGQPPKPSATRVSGGVTKPAVGAAKSSARTKPTAAKKAPKDAAEGIAKKKPVPKADAAPKVRGSHGRFLKRKPNDPLTAADGRHATIVHLAAELAPVARTGGLGEVVQSLAAYQAAAGMPVVILMPLYRQIRSRFPELEAIDAPFTVHVAFRDHGAQLYKLPDSDAADVIGLRGASASPTVYFIDNRDFFDRDGLYGDSYGPYADSARRYAFLGAAAMQVLPRIVPGPVLLHAHDWHTSLALAYLRTWYAESDYHRAIATVLTVHNAGYQGHFSADTMADVGLPASLYHHERFEWYGQMNLLKGGMSFADAVTTVSPMHADELRSIEGGFGLHDVFAQKGERFIGILNGVDQTRWDPTNDPYIAAPFTSADLLHKSDCRRALQREYGLAERDGVPIFVMTARMIQQKGFDLIVNNPLIFNADAQWVFLGSGERRYVDALRALAAQHPDRIAIETTFTDEREHRLMAGADVLLMPCQYEPCGLTQMRAQRYGTVPLVRRVGGLADTVHDGITGFVFDEYSPLAFAEGVARAIVAYRDKTQWERMMRDGMARDFGWERSEERYRDLYHTILSAR
jgi:starch synthase